MTSIKTYTELSKLKTFEERFNYLRLNGSVSKETFGWDRYLNQELYKRDKAWKEVRDKVILRDNGCDLGIDGHEIHKRIIVHHMNPITPEDLVNRNPDIYNPEFLIAVSHDTHQALHYGLEPKKSEFVQRQPNDTCPWKR